MSNKATLVAATKERKHRQADASALQAASCTRLFPHDGQFNLGCRCWVCASNLQLGCLGLRASRDTGGARHLRGQRLHAANDRLAHRLVPPAVKHKDEDALERVEDGKEVLHGKVARDGQDAKDPRHAHDAEEACADFRPVKLEEAWRYESKV